MLIGIINNKIEQLIFKDIQHEVAVELRKTFQRCEEDDDLMSVDNQEDALKQVAERVQTLIKKEYAEPVNKKLQTLLVDYTSCLCTAMSDKSVDVSYRDKLRYGWDGLADYFLLIMYGEADKIEARLSEHRLKDMEGESDDVD